MTKTEITPRLCAGVAVLVPSAFTGNTAIESVP